MALLSAAFVFLVGTVFSFVAFGFGLNAIRQGLRDRENRRTIVETEPADVDAIDGEGPVEVTGQAYPVDGRTISAPFTEEECVAVQYRVLKSIGPDDFRIFGEYLQGDEFLVDDGTGQVLVRLPDDWRRAKRPETEPLGHQYSGGGEGGAVLFPWAPEEKKREAWKPPHYVELADEDPVVETETGLETRVIPPFVEEDIGVDEYGDADGLEFGIETTSKQYVQHLLKPGEDVYVFGVARPVGEDEEVPDGVEHVIEPLGWERREEEPLFLVTDDTGSDAAARRSSASSLRLVGGAVLGVVGVGLFLVTLVLVLALLLG